MKQTNLVPAAVFVILAMTIIWIQKINDDSRVATSRLNTTLVAEQLAMRLGTFMSTRIMVGDQLVHEWEDGLIDTEEKFVRESLYFQSLFPDFQAINWVNPKGRITWVSPKRGNASAIGLNLKDHPVAGAVLEASLKNGGLRFTRPINLAQGGKGIAGYIPLGGTKKPLEGFINLVFRLEPLIENALEQSPKHAYSYQITDAEFPVFTQGNVEVEGELTVNRDFRIANRTWSIAIMPTDQALSIMARLSSKLALILALITSGGLSWLLWLFLNRQQELTEKTQLLGATLNNLDGGITMFDANLKLVACNQTFMDLQGLPPGRFNLGDSYESFIRYLAERGDYGPGDVETQVRERVELARKFEPHLIEKKLPNGTVLEISGKPLKEGGFVTRYTDISERKKSEQALRQSEERFATAFNSSPAAIAIAGIEDGVLLDVNEHWCEVTGYERSEVIGKSAINLGLWKSLKQRTQLIDIMRRDRVVRGFEAAVVTKRGNTLDCIFNSDIIEIDNEERMLLVFHDITERKRAEQQALYLAGHDPLTELPNRNLMRDRLEHELQRAKRYGSKVAVLFVDLDDFKQVNDQRGHKAGDLALQHVTEIMKKGVRASDTIARFGGDEFVIIMPDVDDKTSVGVVCKKLVAAIRTPFDLAGQETKIGASIGIALYPDHAATSEILLEMADKAMYRLKNEADSLGFVFAEGATDLTEL